MVTFSSLKPVLPLAFAGFCYVFVRPLKNAFVRAAVSFAGCTGLILYGCKELPVGKMSSVMTCSFLWMVSIRLIHLMLLPEPLRKELTVWEYVRQFTWFMLPVYRNKEEPRKLPRLLLDGIGLLALVGGKIALMDWIFRYLKFCFESQGLVGEALRSNYFLTIQYVALYLPLILCGPYQFELFDLVISLLTLDKYRVLHFHNWPILSATPREFWGKRYNLLINSLLRDSVFNPLHRYAGFSLTASSLAAFSVSGLLHAHVAHVGFNGDMTAAFFFFLINGIACGLESTAWFQRFNKHIPKFLSILATNAFLFATSPLYPALFVYACPQFLYDHHSALLPPTLQLPIPTIVPH